LGRAARPRRVGGSLVGVTVSGRLGTVGVPTNSQVPDDTPQDRLGWWDRLLNPAESLRRVVDHGVPRLQRLVTEGESLLGAASAIGVAIALQYSLPSRVSQYQRWLFPVGAIILVLIVVVGHRGRVTTSEPLLRGLTLLLLLLMSVVNGIAAVRLINDLLQGEGIHDPAKLLFAGGAIWLTNVIVFALVYWMFDRGGPAARFLYKGSPPDLLFPQQTSRELAPQHWEPVFFDYLYTSFTNATAFSPTDVMPLSRWAKFAMMVESALSLMLAILVIARAVNVLK
jgi:uncharacterized membrane protein